MDPELVAVLQQLLTARKNAHEAGESIPPEAEDAFIRSRTKGKFSRKDLGPLEEISGSNLVRSGMNGATFNWADELLGLFNKHAGDESRLRSEVFAQAHPVADLAGGLAGGIATGGLLSKIAPLKEAMTAKTVGQAVVRGAQTGAVAGAVGGAGSGEGYADRVTRAGRGLEVGAAAGGLLGGAAGVLGAVADPARHGASRISAAIDKSGGIDAVRNAAREMAANGRGDEATLADLSPHLRQALDYAANANDDVLVPTAEMLESRSASRASRLLDDTRRGLPVEFDAGKRAQTLAEHTATVGEAGYGPLSQHNAGFDISQLPLDKPLISRLWNSARLAGNLSAKGPLDDLIAKITAANPTIDRATAEAAAKQVASASAADAGEAAPSLERPATFDDLMQLRRGVNGQVDEAFAKGNGTRGNALKQIRDHIDEVLETGAPGVRDAATAYRGAKDLERALASGTDWWHKADKRQLERVVQQLRGQPGAMEEFRHGIASKLIEMLQGVKTNRDAARELVQKSADMDAKLRIIFGDRATFDTFMARVASERELGKLANTVGGSPTARRLTAQGFEPEHLGIDALVHGPGMIKSAAINAARATMTKRTAGAMGPQLLTQGTQNIESLLQSLGQPTDLVGPGATMLAPMGLMSLFNHDR